MKKVMKLFCRPQSRKCNNRYNRNKHVFQYLLCPTSGFTNLTTTDILDQIILCCRTVLCSVGCLPSTLAPERYHASGSIHPPTQRVTVKNVSTHFQIYSGWQNPPQWGITPLNQWFLIRLNLGFVKTKQSMPEPVLRSTDLEFVVYNLEEY